MIKAVEAYEIMCKAIMDNKDHQIDPVTYTIDEIAYHINRNASNGYQSTYYNVDTLNEEQIKTVLKTVRNEGYMVRRDKNLLEISW